MDQNLNDAAVQGDINTLYAAISNDPFLFDNLNNIPFSSTPLHIAASVGQTDFALEIMMLKPEFGRKLNQNGFSPMHLASINRHEKLVRGLLSLDRDLARVKGKEGRTPLHCLAITGENSSLLGAMLSACPNSIEDLTLKRDTALHLAAKYNEDIVTFKVLIECVKTLHKEEIYSWQDEEGYTPLHHASSRKKIEMIQLLFREYQFKEWYLGVTVKDTTGRTAQDVVEEFPVTDERRKSIIDFLILGTLEGILMPQASEGISVFKRLWLFIRRELAYMMHLVYEGVRKVPTDSRDALLVVLVLVNTTSFQVGINPPGGFWQDDGKASNGKHYVAGTPILATTNPALHFIIALFTMAGFARFLHLIFVLTMGMPMKYLLLFAITFLTYGYRFAFIAITRKQIWIILTTFGIVMLLVLFTSMGFMWIYVKPMNLPKLVERIHWKRNYELRNKSDLTLKLRTASI